MSHKYTSLFLNGFRATGKTTMGPKVAEKLEWEYVESDEEIIKRAGKSIPEITKNGTSWQEFRQMEHDLLKELLKKARIVVSLGGGEAVNTIVKEGTTTTFGELNASLLRQATNACLVLITASDEVIAQRIRVMESAKVTRPILDEKRAKEIQTLLEQYKDNEEKQKEMLVDEIVKDSLHTYTLRKTLYAALTTQIVDTSTISIDEGVSQVLKLLQ